MTIPEKKFGASEPAYLEEEERWTALCGRDRAADGHFVYAVATTGVYCRPSCGARQPLRRNVSFYESPAKAEAAGFRACRRCRPNELALERRQAELIATACRRIEAAEETPSLDELAEATGLSPFHFHRLFKKITGLTPRAYAAAHKAERVKEELARGRDVTHAIYAAGYGSSSRFYESAESRLGMRPSDYRAGGRDARIRFAVGQCSLGHILVAGTERGICEVRLGDDPQALVDELQNRFPRAELIGDDECFRETVRSVVSLVEQPAAAADLPLDLQGTAFQRRVWQALLDIPAGTTESYAEVARRIGAPSATRAVAQACASNRIAVLIPCHRVVRMDGALGGYRWGVERKRELLDREARLAG